jgi:hypothetical protein
MTRFNNVFYSVLLLCRLAVAVPAEWAAECAAGHDSAALLSDLLFRSLLLFNLAVLYLLSVRGGYKRSLK